jgi:rubrerythrin
MTDGGTKVNGRRMGPEYGEGPCEVADTEAAQGNSTEGSVGPVGAKEKGQIYFIETDGGEFVKIGYSKQVLVRLSQLGTLRPGGFALRVMGSIPGTPTIERWLHERFIDDRDNGEWFRKSLRLTAFIESLGLTPPIVIERPERRRKMTRVRALYIQPEVEPEPEAEIETEPDPEANLEPELQAESEVSAESEYTLGDLSLSTVKCLRCGHQWFKRTPERPKQCPNCKQTRWDQPSKWKGKRTGEMHAK